MGDLLLGAVLGLLFVGLSEWLVLRRWLRPSFAWLGVTALGLAATQTIVITATLNRGPALVRATVTAIVFGCIVATGQAAILSRWLPQAIWWVPINIVAYWLVMFAAVLSPNPRNPSLAALGLLVSPLFGLLTGMPLALLFRRRHRPALAATRRLPGWALAAWPLVCVIAGALAGAETKALYPGNVNSALYAPLLAMCLAAVQWLVIRRGWPEAAVWWVPVSALAGILTNLVSFGLVFSVHSAEPFGEPFVEDAIFGFFVGGAQALLLPLNAPLRLLWFAAYVLGGAGVGALALQVSSDTFVHMMRVVGPVAAGSATGSFGMLSMAVTTTIAFLFVSRQRLLAA